MTSKNFTTFLVDTHVIALELKAAVNLLEEHECQLVNYLRATNIEVGLLLNFGKVAEYKRKVYMNKYKKQID
jgi:GxxExxY protein